MYLVSTAKTTVISAFHGLEMKSVYYHENREATDFQIYLQQRVFFEVNAKSGIEVLCIKDKEPHGMEIQRAGKINIEKMFCVACAKQSLDQMAFGGGNGQVHLYNFKNSTLLHRFKTENDHNGVVYLDYNGTDEYIAGVFENGEINVYGTMTKTKIETVNIDSNSTLARFHPSKRFTMAVASYKGAVNVYDLYARQKTCNYLDAHAAPCRDICMSAALPNTLVSVGYDCIANIFDTRHKYEAMQLRHDHPLSTGAISYCGNYLALGNLKGALITYDMRSLKNHLTIKKLHADPVVRLAFVPNSDVEIDPIGFINSDEIASTSDQHKSLVPPRSNRDSFRDYLDYQGSKGERSSGRPTIRRDSSDSESLLLSNTVPLRDRSISRKLTSNLMSIEEEEQNALAAELMDENCKDKHNSTNILKADDQLSIMCSSIPTRECPPKTESRIQQQATSSRVSAPDNIDLAKQIESLRHDMENRFQQLESQIESSAEENKCEILSQASSIWSKQMKSTEDIRDALNTLLQSDPFVVEFTRLKEENELLKAQLKEFLDK